MAHDGTYVDFQANEINIQILFLSEHGCRAKGIAEYIFKRVSPRVEREEVNEALYGPSGRAYPTFSFLPPGLGKIRDFQVRVHVAASCEPRGPAELSRAVLGSSAIVVVSSGQITEARASVERVVSSVGYFEGTPIVLLIEESGGAMAGVEPPVSLVVRARPESDGSNFEALKGALKLSLEKLREAPRPSESLVTVAIPPLLELLREEESKRGRPLSESEVMAVRDRARFVALSPGMASELEKKRGYRDLDAQTIWRDWSARRK